MFDSMFGSPNSLLLNFLKKENGCSLLKQNWFINSTNLSTMYVVNWVSNLNWPKSLPSKENIWWSLWPKSSTGKVFKSRIAPAEKQHLNFSRIGPSAVKIWGRVCIPPEMEILSILLYKTYVTLFDAILHILIFKMLVTLCKFYYLLTKILLHCPNYDHLGFIIYLHYLSFRKCCN